MSTVGKVIEAVTASRIRDLAETHWLLLGCQIGARKGRSAESALELLTEQVHIVWSLGKYVLLLLSLDILGAFNIVYTNRLLDIL